MNFLMNSPFAKAKHAVEVEKDLLKAIPLFYRAIESGDRSDSALKDLAFVLKRLNRTAEAINLLEYHRVFYPPQSRDSIDNQLINFYKSDGNTDKQIDILLEKLRHIESGQIYRGMRTREVKVKGRNTVISIEQELTRLLGDLAWLYMQQMNYHSAEQLYRKALSIQPDRNKQCNLAICLMNRGSITEAKLLLQAAHDAQGVADNNSYMKSYDRACTRLTELLNFADSLNKHYKQAGF